MANDANSTIDITHKKNSLANPCAFDLTKENAATSAKVNGVKDHKKATQLFQNDKHNSVAKAIRYALTLGTGAAFQSLILVFVARLSLEERTALAYAALGSLDDDTAYQTASLVIFGTLKGEAVA